MFAEWPVWQGKVVTIVVGVIVLAMFLGWLWYGRPSIDLIWPQM